MDARIAYLIQQKLGNQAEYLAELKPYVALEYADYRRQTGYNRATERLVQIIVESAIDINEKIIEAMDEPPPASARESFQVMRRLGVMDENAATAFQTYVGLRNRIVHAYEKLDNQIVYFNAKRLLDDTARYIAAVQRFLESHQGESE